MFSWNPFPVFEITDKVYQDITSSGKSSLLDVFVVFQDAVVDVFVVFQNAIVYDVYVVFQDAIVYDGLTDAYDKIHMVSVVFVW